MNDPKPAPAWSVAGLLLICAADLWWRGHTLGPTVRESLGFAPYPVVVGEAEPLDCDEAVYAYVGRSLTRGRVLYRDLSDNKPPLGYWIYAGAVALGGATETTVRLTPVPFVLATIGLVWWLGLRLGGPASACLAAFVYAILSTDPYLFGNGANLEHFLNLFAVAGLAALVRSFDAPGRCWLVAAGALVALASLVKQVAALHLPVFAVALLASDRGGRNWRGKLGDLAALALGFAGPWVAAVGVLWLQGAGPDAFEDVVRYGSALARDKVADPRAPSPIVRWLTGNADRGGKLPWPFGGTTYLVWWGAGSWPLWAASVPALAWLVVGRGADRSRRLAAAWTVASFAEVALPGLYWQHYYLLPTPGVALALAASMADAGRLARSGRLDRKPGRLLAGSVAGLGLAAALVGTVSLQVRDYLMVPPAELTVRYKGGSQWVALREVGRELGRMTKPWPGATLYIWGWHSPLLIESGMDSPTRHFFADPLLEDYARGHHRDHPRVRPRVERIMRDLEARPPLVILTGHRPFPALRQFLNRGYRRVEMLGTDVRSPDGIGLWVDRAHFAAFEAAAGPNAGVEIAPTPTPPPTPPPAIAR